MLCKFTIVLIVLDHCKFAYHNLLLYLWPHTHGNVSLRFCIVSNNELVVLDSLEKSNNTKTQENVSVCRGLYCFATVQYVARKHGNGDQ